METVLWAVCGIAASIGFGLLGSLPRRRARGRAESRSPVVLPVRVTQGRRRSRARLVRVGSEVRLLGPRRHWCIAASDLAQAPSHGVLVDSYETGLRVRLVGPEGPADVVVPDSWREVFAALTTPGAPSTSPRRLRLLRWHQPTWLTALLIVTAVLAGGTALLVGGMTERTSAVTEVTVVQDVPTCRVEWTESDTLLSGAPECPDPTPAVGDPMTYLTTPAPFSGNAWDPTLAGVVVALPLVGLGGLLLFAVARLGRRSPVDAISVTSAQSPGIDPEPGIDPAIPRHFPGAAPEPGLLPLLARAYGVGGWEGEGSAATPLAPCAEPSHPLLSDLVRSAQAVPRWPWLLVLAFLYVWGDQWSSPWPLLVGAASGAALLWALAVGVRTLVILRAAWSRPWTSEWTFHAVPDPEGGWLVLLVVGQTPYWLVPVSTRPPMTGTALVRGELIERASVHLLVQGELWLPDGPAVRMDAEHLDELLEMLTWLVTADSPAPPP